MGLIADVSQELSDKQLARVANRLAMFERMIAASEQLLELDNRKLEDVIKDQPKIQSEYERMVQEARSIENLVDTKLAAVKGELWKQFLTKNQRALTQKDIEMYISAEPDYIAMQELLLEVQYIKRQLEAICKAIESLGYSINNIVKVRIAALEQIVL